MMFLREGSRDGKNLAVRVSIGWKGTNGARDEKDRA